MNIFFETKKTIRFRDGDPAGIMFFGNIFDFAHDAFEDFITHLGFEWKYWYQNADFAIPLRSTRSEYLAPLFPGKTYQVKICISHLGDSSFTAHYQFLNGDKVHAIVELTHTFIDPKIIKKISIPENIRSVLQTYLNSEVNK